MCLVEQIISLAHTIFITNLAPRRTNAAMLIAHQLSPLSALKPGYGIKQANQARKVATYCCQYCGDYKLKEIAEVFGLSHPGSISTALNDVRVLIRSGRLSSQMQQIDRETVIILT